MEGINCHCSTLFPIHSQLNRKQQQQQRHDKLLLLTTNEPPTSLLPHRKSTISPSPLRTNCVASSIVFIATAQAKPPNLNVLLQTGSVLVFMYWIANFVVPNIISKDFNAEKTAEEDGRENDSTVLQDREESTSTQPNSSTRTTQKTSSNTGRKKKGSRSTKS